MANTLTRVTLASFFAALSLVFPCNAAVSADKQAFFNEIFLQNGDVPGLTVGPVVPEDLFVVDDIGYIQPFSLGAEGGYVDYFLFGSKKNASDIARIYRNDIQCVLTQGVWSGLGVSAVGDTSWWGACMGSNLLVLRGELLFRVWFLRDLDAATTRRLCVEIGKRVVYRYNQAALYITPDTAYEECAIRSSPPGARLMNRTASSLTVDSITVLRAASSTPLTHPTGITVVQSASRSDTILRLGQ